MVAMNKIDDIETLKSFIDDNEDLERLESILDRFNIFESLGLVRQEIRHSAFLRWLLDPSETHGLGDYTVSGVRMESRRYSFTFRPGWLALHLGPERMAPIDLGPP